MKPALSFVLFGLAALATPIVTSAQVAPPTAAPPTAAPPTAAPASAAPTPTLQSCCSNKASSATCRNNILQDCASGASECRIKKPGMAPVFNSWWPQGHCVAGQAYCTLVCAGVH